MRTYILKIRLERVQRLATYSRQQKNSIKCLQAHHLIRLITNELAQISNNNLIPTK